MNCKNCGARIYEGQKVCNNCGMKISSFNTSSNSINNDLLVFKKLLRGVVYLIAIFIVSFSYIVFKTDNNSVVPPTKDPDVNYIMNLGVYEFTVPGKYEFTHVPGGVVISDNEFGWKSNIELRAGNFDNYKNKLDSLKILISNQGVNVLSDARVETYNNTEFVNIDVEIKGKKTLLSFIRISDNEVAVIRSINDINTIDYTIIDKIEPILASCENATTNY